MKQIKRFSIEYIRKLGPCYDPATYGVETECYTILDVLRHPEIPFEDKLWLTMRTDFVSERTMRLFAVWSYRQTLIFVKDPDPRSIECANVAEKYAKGEATAEELAAAWSAASAARVAAATVATAAWSAARSAASAEPAAWSAASARSAAAWSAASAWSAAWSSQNEKLIQMVLDGIETGDTVLE